DGGVAVGFVVGAADSLAYEQKLAESWWPNLQIEYAGRKNELPLDSKVLDYIRNPAPAESEFFDRYPAHLHINLLPPAQSGGWGRKLIEAEIESLRRSGVPGVHLGVSSTNYRAIGFYEHVGFTRLAEGDGGIWYGMIL
ncbi:MAG: GNAT family N-acetyltransferase, partial [Devosia sp.]